MLVLSLNAINASVNEPIGDSAKTSPREVSAFFFW
jgi:hypothetical protein